MKQEVERVGLGCPRLLGSCPKVTADEMSFRRNLDRMRSLIPNQATRHAVLSLLDRWHAQRDSVDPIASIRGLLDTIREVPRSDERVNRMNTFLRILGQPEHFATLLDMVRHSSYRLGTTERLLSESSRKSSKHAVYGWCGQTRLVLSGTEPTPNTLVSEPGVQDFLGKTPTSAWSLSMHIWQPNANAKGFECGCSSAPQIIAEPPHSHPFDFSSIVVIGEMHQSIYAQCDSVVELTGRTSRAPRGRYDGITLSHVHGVWPPHSQYEEASITTLENRVLMKAGDSYFMPGNIIHDVQVDAAVSQSRPAITLFLRSEAYTRPHVYMSRAMADFHALNPDLKHQGYPLVEEVWNRKLELVADYVRGKTPTLDLSSIVKYENEYAFFNR